MKIATGVRFCEMEKFARLYEKSHGGMIFGNGKIREGLAEKSHRGKFFSISEVQRGLGEKGWANTAMEF